MKRHGASKGGTSRHATAVWGQTTVRHGKRSNTSSRTKIHLQKLAITRFGSYEVVKYKRIEQKLSALALIMLVKG